MKYLIQNQGLISNLDFKNRSILDKICKIIEKENTILQIFLGGSHAQGTNDKDSDFDIKIIFVHKNNEQFHSLSRNLTDITGVDRSILNQKVINLYLDSSDFNFRKKSDPNIQLSINHQLIDDYKSSNKIVDVFKFSPSKNLNLTIDIECYEIGHFMSMIYKQNIHAALYLHSHKTTLYYNSRLNPLFDIRNKIFTPQSLYESSVSYTDNQFKRATNEDKLINKNPLEFFKPIKKINFVFQYYLSVNNINDISTCSEEPNETRNVFYTHNDENIELKQNTFIECNNQYYYLDENLILHKLEIKSPLDFSIVLNTKISLYKKIYTFFSKFKKYNSIKSIIENYKHIFNSIKTDVLSQIITDKNYSCSRIDKTDIYILFKSKFNLLTEQNNLYKPEYNICNIPKGSKPILIFSYKKDVYEKYLKSLKDYVKWIRLKNESRFKVDISINVKNLAHLVSNLQIYKKYLLYGVIDPKVDNPEYIINIKRGNFNIDEVMNYVDELKTDISKNINFEKQNDSNLFEVLNDCLYKIRTNKNPR